MTLKEIHIAQEGLVESLVKAGRPKEVMMMPEHIETKRDRQKTGRPPLHGAYSIAPYGQLLKGRPKKRLRAYVNEFRRQLAEDLGGPEALSAGQAAVLDRLCGLLTLARMVEMYLSDQGPWQDLAKGELRPVLEQYLKFIRGLLEGLGKLPELARRPREPLDVMPWDIEEERSSGQEAEGEGHHSGD